MKYFKVPMPTPANMDYDEFIHVLALTDMDTLIQTHDETETKDGWQPITEEEWNLAFKAARIAVDKSNIQSDGIDTATITATCPNNMNEITIYVNGEAQLRPVVKGIATLQITALVKGPIRILAGIAPLKNIVNEVIINVN